jgi:hypothetical protein
MKKLIFSHVALAEARVVVLSTKPSAASTAAAVALPHHGIFSDVTTGVFFAGINQSDVTTNAQHTMLRTFVACS